MSKPFWSFYGGKQYKADWIISHFPRDFQDLHYIETCFGSGAVFFKKPPVSHEIINDMDDRIYNFYRVAQKHPLELFKRIRRFLYIESEFKRSGAVCRGEQDPIDEIDYAMCVWYNITFSFNSSVGEWSMRIREGMHDQILRRFSYYPHLFKRLKKVTILNRPLDKVITQFDSENAFFYIDPPYPDTDQRYKFNFTPEDFNRLILQLLSIKGKFMLSFYKKDWMTIPENWTVKKSASRNSVGAWQKELHRYKRREYIAYNYPAYSDQKIMF